VFAGSALADCSFLASDIKTCQSKGKVVTISLGGATGQVGFPDAGTASDFAGTIWDMFLGRVISLYSVALVLIQNRRRW